MLTGGAHTPVVLCRVLVYTPEPTVRRLRVPDGRRRARVAHAPKAANDEARVFAEGGHPPRPVDVTRGQPLPYQNALQRVYMFSMALGRVLIQVKKNSSFCVWFLRTAKSLYLYWAISYQVERLVGSCKFVDTIDIFVNKD